MGPRNPFVIDVPHLGDALLNGMRRAGARFDSCAEDLFEMAEAGDGCLGPEGRLDHIELTLRELGCTEHPTYAEAFDTERLLAWSAQNLRSTGQILCHTEVAALLAYTLVHSQVRPGVLLAGMEALSTAGLDCRLAILASVQLAGEWWFYGITVEGGHRFSFDHRVLLRVRDATPEELEAMKTVAMPKQPKATRSIARSARPEPIPNEYPGQYCGQEAIKSLMLGIDPVQKVELKSLRRRGLWSLWGWFFNLVLARTLPTDMAALLREHGFEADWYFWPTQYFEQRLKYALDSGQYVDVISYAQRRYHGQHSELVSGYEVYDGKTYFYVTDAQFDLVEYHVRQGNALLSTQDFVRSFPRYGLWMYAFGTFVVVATPRS